MARYKKGKNGFYSTTVLLPTGKRKHISAKSITELEARKQELQTSYVLDESTRLADYAREWFAAYKSGTRHNTQSMYAYTLDSYIIPVLGERKLCEIRPIHIQQLVNGLSDRPRTAQIALLTLRQIDKAALRDHLIRDSFTNGIKAPKNSGKTEKRPLTREEQEAVRNADFPPREKAFVYLLFGTGMRRGEALGLQVNDFNLKEHTVTVSRTLIFDGNDGIIEDGPKTENGIRTIPVPASVWEPILAYLRIRSSEAGLQAPLFPGRVSKHITEGLYRSMWKQILRCMKEAGADCDGLTAHIFRHNYATRLYYSGLTMKKAVSLMGHADEKMLMEVYAHLDEDEEKTAQRLDQVMVL